MPKTNIPPILQPATQSKPSPAPVRKEIEMPNVGEAIKTMSKKNEEGILKADSQDDLGAVDSKRIKKDALYKPLLRKFRNFLRKLLDSRGLSKGCHYWTAERMRRKVWKFMHELELPACFMDLKSLNMMMLMLFPTIAKK